MNKSKILSLIGPTALLLGSIFNMVNAATEREIFEWYVTIPLFSLAMIGTVYNIIMISKKSKEAKK